MVENGSTRTNFKTNSRLSDTILRKTTACTSNCDKESPSYTCIQRNVSNHSQNESSRYLRSSSTNDSQFHFSTVSGSKDRWYLPAHIQPESAKPIHKNRTILSNKHGSHTRLPTIAGLDVQNRFIPSLFPSEGSRITQTLPQTSLRSRNTRNDLPTLWPKHSSKDLRNTHKLGGPNPARKVEHEGPSISRRLFNSQPGSVPVAKPSQNNSSSITVSGVASEFREINPPTSKELSLPGSTVATLGQPKKSPTRKDYCHKRKSKIRPRTTQANLEGNAKFDRPLQLCKLCCTSRTTKLSSAIDVHDCATRLPLCDTIPTTGGNNSRAELVVSQLQPLDSLALPSSSKFHSNRCVGPSVGSAIERSCHIRSVVTCRSKVTLQPEGNACDSVCSTETRRLLKTNLNPSTVRQQDSSCTVTKGRGHQINIIDENNSSNLEFSRSISNSSECSAHTGTVQQSSRPLIAQSATARVAPSTSMCRDGVFEVGDSCDRLVCLRNSARGAQLCFPRLERSASNVSQRVQYPMELSASLGVSTPLPDPQSVSPLKSINRDIFSRRPSMGESILASGPQGQSTNSTANAEESEETLSGHINGPSTSSDRQHHSRSLEMWGWSTAVESWNKEQLSLLKNSWRTSTLKTYEVAWKRWQNWCTSNNVNTKSPTGSQLAQFLADLYLKEKLSYNTILLHKSVVSTLCNVETSSHLSTHVLVKHILKSISLKNPRTSKPPVWDVSKLTTFLASCTIDLNNVFQVSRHTAMLLLLCTGRRIHDLTLLRVDPNHCIKSDDSIIFWPEFGSKTDSSDYRQSGFKFIRNPDNVNLDPLYWIDKTILSLKDRRESANCFNLFITVRSIAKAASRTVIAGWVKTLFKEAGITATPGSVRSAVASKSWLNNHSIDDILARGNWRSANTFERFYRRQVMSANENTADYNVNNVSHLFNPVD